MADGGVAEPGSTNYGPPQEYGFEAAERGQGVVRAEAEHHPAHQERRRGERHRPDAAGTQVRRVEQPVEPAEAQQQHQRPADRDQQGDLAQPDIHQAADLTGQEGRRAAARGELEREGLTIGWAAGRREVCRGRERLGSLAFVLCRDSASRRHIHRMATCKLFEFGAMVPPATGRQLPNDSWPSFGGAAPKHSPKLSREPRWVARSVVLRRRVAGLRVRIGNQTRRLGPGQPPQPPPPPHPLPPP
jgi:hypothetical protein